jgi:hypothetical protein
MAFDGMGIKIITDGLDAFLVVLVAFFEGVY